MGEDKIFKATLRIPTKEQYAYVEIQVEGTMKEIFHAYLLAQHTYQQKAAAWEKDKPPF